MDASSAVAPTAKPAASAPAHPDPRPRIYSKRRHVWIFYEPSASSGWMGFLGLGSSVPLRSAAARSGDGCEKFYPVEPRGWVCLNQKTTLDANEPEYRAILAFAPKLQSPFPHNYGESRGTPRYKKIPTLEEQRRREYKLEEHLENVRRLRAGELDPNNLPKSLRGVDVTPAGHGPPPEWARLPAAISEERDYLKPLSTVAWSQSFDAEGRTWLVTGDLALVPKDKVSRYPRSDFKGIALQNGVALPLAFAREKPAPKFKRSDSGEIAPADGEWPRLSWFAVRDQAPVRIGDQRFVVTADGALLASLADVTVARRAMATPWGAPVEGVTEEQARAAGVQRVPAPEGGRRTWLEVSVLGGWVVAYEDTRPVYASLIAPGRGGIPQRGVDPLETASTPVGRFRVDGKFYTSTMANAAFVHSDVPFSQNFHGPHVLHQAYWHDGWGEKRSAGCINFSPHDALWLFGWTEPPMPEGWFGLRSDSQAGPATIVYVHE
ncbi:MAG: L,D-transpeptidase [Polyangiaceae bacterium]|nr:L,D-transpeptidase [Polyangiaceae bacterium]